MARKLTVAAAQTGPVFGGMQDGVEAACAMVKEGARKGVDIICFPEVFLAPFFPGLQRNLWVFFRGSALCAELV
jgi:predicted amidohydrolase